MLYIQTHQYAIAGLDGLFGVWSFSNCLLNGSIHCFFDSLLFPYEYHYNEHVYTYKIIQTHTTTLYRYDQAHLNDFLETYPSAAKYLVRIERKKKALYNLNLTTPHAARRHPAPHGRRRGSASGDHRAQALPGLRALRRGDGHAIGVPGAPWEAELEGAANKHNEVRLLAFLMLAPMLRHS